MSQKIDTNLMTEKKFLEAIIIEDFNEAIFFVQTTIGQKYGDVAGIHFSGDSDEQLEIKWSVKKDRLTILQNYLKVEVIYADLAKD